MPGPTILCRRLSFYVAATGLSSSSISHPHEARSFPECPFSPYEDTLHMPSQGDRRVNAPSRKTGSPYVRAGSAWTGCTADDRPRAFRASAIKNSVRSRRYLAVKIDEARTATQSAMYRGFDRSPRREHRCCIRSGGPRVIERGPPGTRRAPSAAADSFGASVRTRSAYLLRTGVQKGPRARRPRAKNIFTRRRISAVAKRPCLRSDDRSWRTHW